MRKKPAKQPLTTNRRRRQFFDINRYEYWIQERPGGEEAVASVAGGFTVGQREAANIADGEKQPVISRRRQVIGVVLHDRIFDFQQDRRMQVQQIRRRSVHPL